MFLLSCYNVYENWIKRFFYKNWNGIFPTVVNLGKVEVYKYRNEHWEKWRSLHIKKHILYKQSK